jgi:hypothetical protein
LGISISKMKMVENLKQEGGSVTLEDTLFINCSFTGVAIIYQGGDVSFAGTCKIDRCSLHFTGAAGKAMVLLQQVFDWGPRETSLVRPI